MGIRDFFLGKAQPQEPVFVRNIDLTRTDFSRVQVVGGVIGRPQATEWYTQARLEDDGIAGLYRTGRRTPQIVPT